MPVPATTSASETGRTKNLRPAATAVTYDSTTVTSERSFLAWFDASAADDSALWAVVHALYYLPQQFMIMLPRAMSARLAAMADSTTIVSRIRYYDTEGSSHDEPSLVADAVITGSAAVADDRPTVEIEDGHQGLSTDGRHYVVGQNPEAVASALLAISRA